MKSCRRLLTGLLLALLATTGWAQSWPNKPVRMIIAFPPGGPTDLVSRVLAQRLSEQLGQQVIVDNKPGAGGNLAAELAAKAAPDGYTIFYNTSAIVIGPALYGKVNYDTLKDFAPVALTASVPMVLVVNPQLPARSVKEFLELAKSRPGALNYSSSGTGTITHLASAMVSTQTGVQTQHIPYKGSAPGLVDLVAGQTQFMIDTINTVLPYVRDNRLRGLAVTSSKRSSLLPDLPTLAESGLSGFDAAAWQGVVVPAGTPADIIQKLNAEVNKALANPDLRARLAAQGAEILGGIPAEYAAHLRTEMPRWAKAVKDSGAKAE
ncbi:tripartite tricarboxylate transporter substrate binding protein [Limnohabitans sp. Jir72]|uniref:tripartite tricarboxylate transporter substrate binding protein n=1 Tax=Limnohabitans sp. Jir72 TaxID=1977909 RepID=UPI000D37AC02|nr:tripartite tricarboxylate transporter substrate binding protein [Limnohabitans sp. Jir72]PUE35127.1 LacI family transcriptional regulator [Limnohabitans sp. Jir72]